MATRAEQFRALQERTGSGKAKKRQAPATPPGGTEARSTGRAGKKAQYALEVSEGRPSRKSTRGSANRQRNDVQFRLKRRVREAQVEGRPRGEEG